MIASPVVTSVSHATRPTGSWARMASRMESEIWSAILSGWPSVTDSDVKRWRPLRLMRVELLCCAGASRKAGRSTQIFRDLLGLSEEARRRRHGRRRLSNPANITAFEGLEQHALVRARPYRAGPAGSTG